MTIKTDTIPYVKQLQALFGGDVQIVSPLRFSDEERQKIVEDFDEAHYGGGWVYGGCVTDKPPCTPSNPCYTNNKRGLVRRD